MNTQPLDTLALSERLENALLYKPVVVVLNGVLYDVIDVEERSDANRLVLQERKSMDPRLDNSDWAEVFGEGSGGNTTPINPQPQPPTYGGSLATFGRKDVAEIFQMEDGENDGPEWIIYGRLKDGRYFSARGGCDYTGWDCRASNSGDVAATREAIIRFGLTDTDRERFGIVL